MLRPWYATREAVKEALDSAETARNNRRVDRALEQASRSVELSCHRPNGFFPTYTTKYKEWPDDQGSRAYRLWLDADEVIELTAVVSGGSSVPLTDVFLEPANYGPPFELVEVSLASSSGWSAGNTHQRAVALTGLFGHSNDEEPAGALSSAGVVSLSTTSVDVTDSAALGVGDLVRVDEERMIVTDKRMATTSQTLQTPVTAATSDVTVAVTNGAAFAIDETILLDAERMRVVDIAGNNLVVKRAWDGSVLAAHTGSTIYALRTLTVERGALGTTATTHAGSVTAYRWLPPGPVESLTVARALVQLGQESSQYARTSGSDDNQREIRGVGLIQLTKDVKANYARKARFRTV